MFSSNYILLNFCMLGKWASPISQFFPPLLFYTMPDKDAEFRLTIMASVAQEESRKTSERVKWGMTRRMENGKVSIIDLFGYDKVDGRLFINHEEAEVVKLIFHKYVYENKGLSVIAQELNESGGNGQ